MPDEIDELLYQLLDTELGDDVESYLIETGTVRLSKQVREEDIREAAMNIRAALKAAGYVISKEP